MERKNVTSVQGNPLTLLGPELSVGQQAPDFTVLDGDMNPVRFSSFKGKTVIISAVPSLDTPVCELQTQRFNSEAASLNAVTLTISMDLPFAQKRFCDSFKIGNLKTLSDFRDREFSRNYGLYIREIGLIARAVLVVDSSMIIRYIEIVNDISKQPDYDSALAAARQLGA